MNKRNIKHRTLVLNILLRAQKWRGETYINVYTLIPPIGFYGNNLLSGKCFISSNELELGRERTCPFFVPNFYRLLMRVIYICKTDYSLGPTLQ